MSRIILFCATFFLFGCVECLAQRDSVSHSFIPETVSSPFLRNKWLGAEVPGTCLLPLRNYAEPINTLQIGNLRLRSNWYYEPIFLSDNHPHASAEEYNAMLRNGLGFTYDPLNPYGVNSASTGLIDGSVNFLLMLMFPCK